jgi:hypothetical protein
MVFLETDLRSIDLWVSAFPLILLMSTVRSSVFKLNLNHNHDQAIL